MSQCEHLRHSGAIRPDGAILRRKPFTIFTVQLQLSGLEAINGNGFRETVRPEILLRQGRRIMTGSRFVTKVLQRYWRFARGLTLGAQGLIVDAHGRVLLVRHSYRPGWHFPGGGVEKNEPVETALEREINEETGVTLRGPAQLFGVYANFRHFPSDHVALFVIREWDQLEVPPANREIAEQGFFAIDALPDGTHRSVVSRLQEVFQGQPRDPLW
jgi:ADP-ribose pyrophosphatase YjhB (NUDIX family)